MEGADHLLEFAGGSAPALVGRVPAVGGEERQGHVAPGVGGAGPSGLGGVGLVDGQELDGGDAGGLEVRRQHPRAPVRALVLGGDAGHALEAGLADQQVRQPGRGGMAGELRDARLVDDGPLRRQLRLADPPVAAGAPGILGDDNALGGVGGGVDPTAGHAVDELAAGAQDPVVDAEAAQGVGVDVVGDLTGVGVEEDLVGVESVALLVEVGDEAGVGAGGPGLVVGPVGAPDAEADEGSGLQAAQSGAPYAVGAAGGQEDGRGGGAEGLGVDLQLDAGGGGGVDGEGGAVGPQVGAERPGGLGPGGLIECGDSRHAGHGGIGV